MNGTVFIGAASQVGADKAIAFGYSALATHEGVIAVGESALASATNTIAVGEDAQATANNAIVVGNEAIVSGANSIGIGRLAEVTANTSVGVGFDAMITQANGVAIGIKANLSGADATALGALTNVSGVNSTAVGFNVSTTANNEVVFGDEKTVSVGGIVPWTQTSDGRFKKDLRNDVPGMAFISRLRPVTYELDQQAFAERRSEKVAETNNAPAPKRQTGFIAQEVEDAAKETGYEFSGVDQPQSENDLYGLRYADFVAPLTKAVQKLNAESKQISTELQERNFTFAEQEKQLAQFAARLAEAKEKMSKAKKDKGAK